MGPWRPVRKLGLGVGEALRLFSPYYILPRMVHAQSEHNAHDPTEDNNDATDATLNAEHREESSRHKTDGRHAPSTATSDMAGTLRHKAVRQPAETVPIDQQADRQENHADGENGRTNDDTTEDSQHQETKGKGKERAISAENGVSDDTSDMHAKSTLRRPQLPAEKPFDFNRFLEQMKHRSAVPVNEYVRSFFRGFTRRPYKPDEQVKLIFDFLDFIAKRMMEAAVWADLPPNEFDQATEAMEKLVMNRLYTYTFSPAIAMEGRWSVQTDDLEHDRKLSERIQLFAWVREEHLDVKRGQHSERFYNFAAQELSKINHYKAPRDKTICILNCCKVIFGLIRHLGSDESADSFMPLLILVVIRANPPNLISNLEYIQRFRSPQRRSSESEYYLSSLAGAITFIERMDHTTLSRVTQTQLDANMQREAAKMEAEAAEKSESTARPFSLAASVAAVSLADDTRAFIQRTGEAARLGFNRLFTERSDMVQRDARTSELRPLPSASSSARPVVPPVTPAGTAPQPHLKPARGVAPNAPLRVAGADPMHDDSPRSVSTPHTQVSSSTRVPRWRSGLMPRFDDDDERDVAGAYDDDNGNDDDADCTGSGLRDSPSRHVAAAIRYANGDGTLDDVDDERGDTERHAQGDDADIDASVDVAAAIQTLQSIFPQADTSVLQLVLEECGYNVETSIDRLLEMT